MPLPTTRPKTVKADASRNELFATLKYHWLVAPAAPFAMASVPRRLLGLGSEPMGANDGIRSRRRSSCLIRTRHLDDEMGSATSGILGNTVDEAAVVATRRDVVQEVGDCVGCGRVVEANIDVAGRGLEPRNRCQRGGGGQQGKSGCRDGSREGDNEIGAVSLAAR